MDILEIFFFLKVIMKLWRIIDRIFYIYYIKIELD